MPHAGRHTLTAPPCARPQECTTFHFECKPDALRPALDRFAQFFISPLCKAEALGREVQAVDNEFSGVLQSDSCRLQQLRCHAARDGHVFRKFGWGNIKSLAQDPEAAGIDVRSELLAYYKCAAGDAAGSAKCGGAATLAPLLSQAAVQRRAHEPGGAGWRAAGRARGLGA